MRTARREAFTLLELLLVIVILGVIASFVWPEFSPAAKAEQLDESTRRLKSLVAMCRAEAMNDARNYRITLRLDGRVWVTRQFDSLLAPQAYVRVRAPWAQTEFVLEDVWVEAVRELPDGPPPLVVVDEDIDFDDEELELFVLDELETPLVLEFRPNGSSNSATWTLRDGLGRGRQMTLDGRLGRVTIVPLESLRADEVERPLREVTDEDDQAEQSLYERLRAEFAEEIQP